MELITFGAFSAIAAGLALHEKRLVEKGRLERAKPGRIFFGTFVVATLGYFVFEFAGSVAHVFAL